jgi:outer membrane protein assembly factor BamD
MKLVYIFILCLLSACTSNKLNLRDHKGTYSESVKVNFEAGEAYLKKDDFDKAIAYFQFVRSKYPFSQYASLSDLRIADTKYAQKKWLDAAAGYEIFIRLHPRHDQVCYASFKLSSSYFHAIPSDSFLWPHSSTRDQSFTKEALSAVEQHIFQFSDSAHMAEAQKMRGEILSKLAKAAQQVGAYYHRRKRYEAAVARYLSVHELYPEAKESAESLFKAAQILEYDLKNKERALEIYDRLINLQHDNSYAQEAQKRVLKLVEQNE